MKGVDAGVGVARANGGATTIVALTGSGDGQICYVMMTFETWGHGGSTRSARARQSEGNGGGRD